MAATNLPRVPEGLRDLMKAYTKEVLREKPTNLYEFSSNFFEKIAAAKKHYKVVKYEPSQSYEMIMKNRLRQQIPLSAVYNIIPDKLTELIKKFIKAVLKENPENLLAFAIEYFHKLHSMKSPNIEYSRYASYEQSMEKSGINSSTPKETCICGRRLNGKTEEPYTQTKVEETKTNVHQKEILDGKLSVSYLQAVCIIQRYFRQYLKHKKNRPVKDNSKTEDLHKSQDYFNAVLIIQKQFRKYLARKRAETKTELKNDSYHSAEYIKAVSIIQRYCRRYLKRKNQAKSKENKGSNKSDIKVSMTTAAFVIQRAFRRMVRARRAKKHIQAEPDDDVNDNASEAASYTSASTALLSTESTGEHNEFGGNNYEEGVHQQTIQEDEEVENDNVNLQNEYKTKAIKSSGKSISSNGNDKNNDDVISDSQIDQFNNEELRISKTDKTQMDIYNDSTKTFGNNLEEEKVKSNDTLNKNIINNLIKAETDQILSDHPESKNDPAEEKTFDKKHIGNVDSSLETDIQITNGRNVDFVSEDIHNAEEETIQTISNRSIEECSSNNLMKSKNDVQEGTLELVENSKQDDDENKKVIINPEEVTISSSPTKPEKTLSADSSEGFMEEIKMPSEEIKPQNDNSVDKSNQNTVSELITNQGKLEDSNGAQKSTESEIKLSSEISKDFIDVIDKPLEEEIPQDCESILKTDEASVSDIITKQEELLDAPQKPIDEVAQQDDEYKQEHSSISRTTSNKNLSLEDLKESLKAEPHFDEVDQHEDESLVKPTQNHSSHSTTHTEKLDNMKELPKPPLKQHSDIDETPVDLQNSEIDLQKLLLKDTSLEADSKLNSTENNTKGSNTDLDHLETVSEHNTIDTSQPENVNSVEVNSLQSVLSTLKNNHTLDKENLQTTKPQTTTTDKETSKLERVSSSTSEALSPNTSTEYEYPEIIKAQIHKAEEETMQDVTLEELGKSIIIHSVLPGEDDYELPISSDDSPNLSSKNIVNEELLSTSTLKQDDAQINTDVLTDKINDELLDSVEIVKHQKSKENPLPSEQSFLDTSETIETPIIQEEIGKENMGALKDAAQLELKIVENNPEEKHKEIEDQPVPIEIDDETKTSSFNKTIEFSQHLENIADPIKMHTDLEAAESASLDHSKLTGLENSEHLDSKNVASERKTKENSNTNKVEERELIPQELKPTDNTESERHSNEISIEAVPKIKSDVTNELIKENTTEDSSPSSIEVQNAPVNEEKKGSIQKQNSSEIEKVLSSSEEDRNIINKTTKNFDTSSYPINAEDSDTTTKNKESVEEEKQKSDIVSEDSKNKKDDIDSLKTELKLESENNKILITEQITMGSNTDLVNASERTNLQNESQDSSPTQSASQEKRNKSDDQESHTLLDEEEHTFEPKDVVENNVIRKRYINEETGEYTHFPEKIIKSDNLMKEVNESDETQVITTLFKTEEDRLLSSNNDKINSNDNDNSEKEGLITENNEQITLNKVDPPNPSDDGNGSIQKQPNEHNAVLSNMAEKSLKKHEDENSNVNKASLSESDEQMLDSATHEKKSPLHMNQLSDTQVKKVQIAKEKQITSSQSGRLVNAPIAELQLKSFKSTADSGPWYEIHNDLNEPQSEEAAHNTNKDIVYLSNEQNVEDPHLPLTPSHKYSERISNYMYGEELSTQDRNKPKQSISFFVSFDGDDGKTSFKIPKKFLKPNPQSSDKTSQKNVKNQDIDYENHKDEIDMDPIIIDEDEDDLRFSQYGQQKLQTIHELNENESSNELKLDMDRAEEMKPMESVIQEVKVVVSEINEATQERKDSNLGGSNELIIGEETSNIVEANKTDHSNNLEHVKSVQIIERAYKNFIARRNMNLKLKTLENNEKEITEDLIKNVVKNSEAIKYKPELTEHLAASRIQKAVRQFLKRSAVNKNKNTDFKDSTYSAKEISAALRIQKFFKNYIERKNITKSEMEVRKDIEKEDERNKEVPKHIGESKSLDALADQTESIFGENTLKDDEPSSIKPEWFVGSQRISLESIEPAEAESISPGMESDVDSNARMLEYTHDTQTESPIVGTHMGLHDSKLIPDIGNIVHELNPGELVEQDNGDFNNSAGSSNEDVLDSAKDLTVSPSTEPGLALKVDASTRQMLNEFLSKEIEYCSTQKEQSLIPEKEKSATPDEVQELECIKKSVSLTTDQDLENDIEKTKEENVAEVSKVEDDAMEEAASKLSKPDEVIEKMSQRRSAELRDRRKDDFVIAEPSFDEPIIRPMSSLQEQSSLDIEDGDIIVYNRLHRDETRESSAQSESVVFGTEDDDKVINVETNRTQLARHYTIAGDDPHVIFRSVTIDENVKYIDDGNDESLGGMHSNSSFCLDDETSENIRKKIMAYSLSEGDSDNYDPNKIVNDDFHIDTAMTDAMDTSTETESTIVSAATKIQAGARGFLARRRLRRASAGTNASTMDTKASFGNDAISESLERFIEEEAAKKIQVAYRLHSRKQKKQTNQLKSASLESSLAAKRLTLQRGDALRNDSNTTPEDENSENTTNGMEVQKVMESKQRKSTAGGSTKKKPAVELSWLPKRQNSMPVQIDCEVMRPIPKHMRKRIKSAENGKRKTHK